MREFQGELWAYTPKGKQAKTIRMIVERGMLEVVSLTSGRTVQYKLRVMVAIEDVPTVNVNGDKINIALRIGTAAQDFPCADLLEGQAGFWRIGLGGAG